MKKGTETTLVEDLKKELEKSDGLLSFQIQQVIERAENGDYHDLKAQLPIPKVLLHRDCLLLGLEEIAKKVFTGEYDEL